MLAHKRCCRFRKQSFQLTAQPYDTSGADRAAPAASCHQLGEAAQRKNHAVQNGLRQELAFVCIGPQNLEVGSTLCSTQSCIAQSCSIKGGLESKSQPL
jgi:hypothetical protein